MANPKAAISKAHKTGRKTGRSTAQAGACLGGGVGGFVVGFFTGAIDAVKELLPESEEEEQDYHDCPKCGTSWELDVRFCGKCATPLTGSSSNGSKILTLDQPRA